MSNVQPGQTIGPYVIINQVRSDGALTTFKAYASALARDVLISVITAPTENRAEFARRLGAVADSLRALKHPNIELVQEVGEADGIFYLVTRELAASTLAERLRLGPLSLADAAKIVGQVAATLQYAHAQGMTHGSLNPNNILIDSSGNALLTQLGLSDLLAEPAPQQSPAQTDQRADIFALGRALATMLSGRESADDTESLSDVISRQVNASSIPTSLQPAVAQVLEAVINKATAKIPSERFASVADFLQAWETGIATSASATATQPQTEREQAQAAVRERLAAEAQTKLDAQKRMEAEARAQRERLEAEARQQREAQAQAVAAKSAQMEAEIRAERERKEREVAAARAQLEAAVKRKAETIPPRATTAGDAKRGELLKAARSAQTSAEQRLQAEKERLARDAAELKQKAQRKAGAKLTPAQAEQLRQAREKTDRNLREQQTRQQQARQQAQGAGLTRESLAQSLRKAGASSSVAGQTAGQGVTLLRRLVSAGVLLWVLCIGCFVLVGVFGSSGASSSRTPTPTRTPAPRASPTIENIVQVALTASALTRIAATSTATRVVTAPTTATTPRPSPTPFASALVFSDTFRSGACELPEGDNANRTVKCDSDEYVVLNKTDVARWFYYEDKLYGDFMAEVEGRVISGTNNTEFGLVFRVSSDGKSMYGAAVSRDGKLNVFRYQNDSFTNLLPTLTGVVNASGKNKLRVIVLGSRLIISVNDRNEFSITDANFARGAIGLFVRNSQPNAQVAFSNLRVFAATSASAPLPSPTR